MSPNTDMEPEEGTLHSTPVTAISPGALVTLDPHTLLARSETLTLDSDTVHVWSFILEDTAEVIAQCRELLSSEERHRADRFVFDRDRFRYILAHGVLRHLLGCYCGLPPESLRFVATSAGKPALCQPSVALRFNLSHSENRALLGVSANRELGIDLERVRSNIETLSISSHYFFGSEREDIAATPSPNRDNTFFRYWVAKEAVLKAQGIGLGFPLDRFRVDFQADGDTARIDTLDAAALAADWIVRMLPCESGWLGAVAATGTDWVVKPERLDVTDTPHL